MKINTKLRIKAIKRILSKLEDKRYTATIERKRWAIKGDYKEAKLWNRYEKWLYEKVKYWNRRLKRYKKLKK